MKTPSVTFRCPLDLQEKLDYLCVTFDPSKGPVDRSTVLRYLIEDTFRGEMFRSQLEFESMLHKQGLGPDPLQRERGRK